MKSDLIQPRIYNPPASKTNLKTKKKKINKISKIINDKNVKKNVPTQFNKTEQISTVYTLSRTIKNL